MIEEGKIFLEDRSYKLSKAIYLKDSFCKGLPIGWIEVNLNDSNAKAIKKPDGYYLFLNLPKGKYSAVVTSEYYITKSFEFEVTYLSTDGQKEKLNKFVIEIILDPRPGYPFPS